MSDQPDQANDAVALEPTPAPRRRRVLLGAVAVVAVAAAAVGVATFAGDDDAPEALPVALGAPASGRDAAATMEADMSLAAPVIYVAGDDLPALGGKGPAYRLSDDVAADEVTALADALGLDGAPEQRDGLWHLSTDAGTVEVYPGGGASWWYSSASTMSIERSIDTSTGGGTSGSVGSIDLDCAEPANEDVKVRCAALEDAEGSGTTTVPADTPVPADPEVLPFEPPADLPSEDEATSIALDLLGATGLDLRDAKVTVDGPYDSWYVSVEPRLDGQLVSGLMASVSVGPEGEVLYASGYLADPERLGDYDVVDTGAAIDRLNEQMGGFAASAAEGDAVAPGDDVVTTTTFLDGREPAIGTDAVPCPDPFPSELVDPPVDLPADAGVTDEVSTTLAVPPDVAVESPVEAPGTDPVCGTPEPYEPPAPVEVVLHEAERVLVAMATWDGTDELYLVPGYRLRGDDGVVVDAVAIDEGALAPVEPTQGGSGSGSGGSTGAEPGRPGVIEPAPAVDPAVEPGTEPATDPAVGDR